jgi:hypothetical protein
MTCQAVTYTLVLSFTVSNVFLCCYAHNGFLFTVSDVLLRRYVHTGFTTYCI